MDFSEYFWSFKLFVGTYITFLKGYDVSYWKICKNLMSYPFVKKFVKSPAVKAERTVPKIDFLKNGSKKYF